MAIQQPVALWTLDFLFPLSFKSVNQDAEFQNLAAKGAKFTSICYTPAALVAFFSDGTAAYLQRGSYGGSAARPLSEYLDASEAPRLRAVAAGSLHFVGLTQGGRLVSSRAHYGQKIVRQLDAGDAALSASIAAGFRHALAITQTGGLLAWAVSDDQESHAAVRAFVALPSAGPAASQSDPSAAAGGVVVGAPRQWAHPELLQGRLRVTHASAGSVHSLLALSDGRVYLAGIKASQRFSRSCGMSTTYVDGLVQVQLPIQHHTVLLAEACGSNDTCCVATDRGVVCWADDRTKGHRHDKGWYAEYAPAPRHVPQLDGVEVQQIALSEVYNMAAALATDGRIFLWCIKLADVSWPKEWEQPSVAATAPGALAVGWSDKDLYVCMPEGSAAGDIRLAPPRASK